MADKMMFEHRDTGGVVEYLGPVSAQSEEGGQWMACIRVACECGEEHAIELDDFLRNFELMQKVKTMELSAPADDLIWEEIEAVARKHGFDPEEVDEDDDDDESQQTFSETFDLMMAKPSGTG